MRTAHRRRLILFLGFGSTSCHPADIFFVVFKARRDFLQKNREIPAFYK
ncbi:hypothetical protein CLOSTHATH_01065 [Hungatella hathewayi DSM 13479]|uniref:Uncharacterized protein n=1 Tax=Hungatella hathewayi DSM 13479 TaxID=566550 RepID=D3ABT7_9FIRM|nr:hypothetical protein CLOSTHATH_01065 [Hungatella hathewayi DSM 13479]